MAVDNEVPFKIARSSIMASLEKQIENQEARDMNRDPITGAPGAHPVGTGIGAAGGAVVGAAAGVLAGPIGAVLGGVVGAVAGGLVGKGSGEELNPTGEEAYWRKSYRNEPYYDSGYTFEDYAPAFLAGYVYRMNNRGTAWNRAEATLQADWESNKEKSNLHWEHAKHAVHAAWHRVNDSFSGTGAKSGART
jgi:hypothetical protein